MYGPFLAPYLQKPVRLLEIGVFNGRAVQVETHVCKQGIRRPSLRDSARV